MARPTDQEAFDALLRTRLAAFTRKAFATVDPGAAYKHNWHIDLIAEYLEACTRREIKRLIINIPPRYLKLLADDTPVPTPKGVKQHGDLRVGDEVFSPTGEPVKVIAVMPKDVADYQVTLSNGERIACNLDHLWTVYDRAGRKWRTVTTGRILRTKYYSGRRCRFQLPDSGCLEYPSQLLPLSPYFLGAWLGDGTWNKPCITHHADEHETVEAIVADGYAVSTRCPHPCGTTVTTYFSRNGIGKRLQSLGVWENKHIPPEYLQSSREQRLELLAGIIDTDGSVCNDTGRVTIVGINKPLGQDVFRLCAELGFRPYVTWQKTLPYNGYGGGKDRWHLGFNPTMPIPTRVPRKRLHSPKHIRRGIGIAGIEKLAEPKPGNCISVDTKEGLYVVGRRHVVTHNSVSVTVAWPAWLLGHDPSERVLSASYAEVLALKHSMDTRLVMQSDWYRRIFPGVQLTGDQNEKRKFVTTHRGHRFATSVGASTIGEGGRFLIVDDPLNAAQAVSVTERERANTWFDQGFSTRLDDKENGVIVVVMQRLHANDLSGHLLAKGGWEHLSIPAVAETRTIIDFGRVKLTREAGDILHPARESAGAIERQKIAMGSMAFCTPRESPVLMADLSLKPIGDVLVGDSIVGIDTGTASQVEDCTHARRKLLQAKVLAISRSKRPVVKLTLDSGKVIRCTRDHRWYTGRNDATHPMYAPAAVGRKLLRVCDDVIKHPIEPDDVRLAGWLAGFFDGDGSATWSRKQGHHRPSCLISFAQGAGRNLPLCEKLEAALSHFGFTYGYHERIRSDRVNNRETAHKSRWYYLTGNSLPMFQAFLHVVQPTKWRDRIAEGALGANFVIAKERVISIEPDGEEEVFGLTTSTGNYIVWGFASSNSGQYQQRPTPLEGGIFKAHWFKRYDAARDDYEQIVQSWDTAYKPGQLNDPSACTTWGVRKDGYDLLHVLNKRLEYPDLKARAIEHAAQWKATAVLIEDKASGQSLLQDLRRETALPVIAINPKGDKETRASAVSAMVEAGKVALPQHAAWLTDYEMELMTFPNGVHDDMTDSTSMFLEWIRGKSAIATPSVRRL